MQIQPKGHALAYADYAAPTRQNEPDHIQIIQIRNLSALKDLDHEL